MIQIENKYLKMIREILAQYPYRFYAYGSRAKGNARKLSDLDLCCRENIPQAQAFLIKEEFKESNLPFVVELVNWNHMSSDFQKLIEKDLVLI